MCLTQSQKVSPSRVRKPNVFDYQLICCQITKAVSLAPDKECSYKTSPSEAARRIVNRDVDAVILDDSYLLVYNVGSPWYGNKVYLAELMVLRLKPGASFSVVPDMLDDLASKHNVDAILVGGALTPRASALIRLYRRHGFVLEDSPTMIKRRG